MLGAVITGSSTVTIHVLGEPYPLSPWFVGLCEALAGAWAVLASWGRWAA